MTSRRRPALAVVLATLLATAVFLAGPRTDLDVTVHPLSLPTSLSALDEQLKQQEARFADMRPGDEARIVWHDPQEPTRTDLSIVYIHGFSAGPREIWPVCQQLADELGANLFYARLTGHGRSEQAMVEGSVNSWINDGVEALEIGHRLGSRVLLIATSTGATLATWLASQASPADLEAMVLISPNFGPRDRRSEILLLPWGQQLARWIVGPYHGFEPLNETQALRWTTRYPTEALLPMMGLVELSRRLDLSEIEVPTLLFYSNQDQIVDAEELQRRFALFGGNGNVAVEIPDSGDPTHHVLTGDTLSPGTTAMVVDRIISFMADRERDDPE